MNDAIKLTQYSHGGGCGCKIAPSVLTEMLAALPCLPSYPNLMVGTESSDDAAVYKLNETQAIVVTTDFFMPIVDDARDFGRISATNALSDIYAMGATPIFALAILGMPISKLPVNTIREILSGGTEVCKGVGIPIAGGHSIDSPEPIYGLVGVGVVHPDHIKRNDSAQDGDILILGKPLGVGVLSAALKKGELNTEGYRQMLDTTTQLNCIGSILGGMNCVHAMTDVTGFGLLGHLLEVCRGSRLGSQLNFPSIPFLAEALRLAKLGYSTGAADRNWDSYGMEVDLPQNFPDWNRKLLCDPQTSGGLLVTCAADEVEKVLVLFRNQGFSEASIIGKMVSDSAQCRIRFL